jgi:hypothetical protein
VHLPLGGRPLVCLHTAGADARPFRHLLSEETITWHFRALTFDMPWHGAGLRPSLGFELPPYQLNSSSLALEDFRTAFRFRVPVVTSCCFPRSDKIE